MTPERVERVARLHKYNDEAAAALGISPVYFGVLCRRHGIETPAARRRNTKKRILS